jgi:hypothetical protein
MIDWTPDSDFRFILGLVAWALLFGLVWWRLRRRPSEGGADGC